MLKLSILKYVPTFKHILNVKYRYISALEKRFIKQEEEAKLRKELEEKSKQAVRVLGPDERIAFTFTPNTKTEESPLQASNNKFILEGGVGWIQLQPLLLFH